MLKDFECFILGGIMSGIQMSSFPYLNRYETIQLVSSYINESDIISYKSLITVIMYSFQIQKI